MTFFLVASGATLTIGIGLGCLIVSLRDAFARETPIESEPPVLGTTRAGRGPARDARTRR